MAFPLYSIWTINNWISLVISPSKCMKVKADLRLCLENFSKKHDMYRQAIVNNFKLVLLLSSINKSSSSCQETIPEC